MSILNLIKTDVFPHIKVVCHLVVASADTKHTVANAADVELRRLMRSVVQFNVMSMHEFSSCKRLLIYCKLPC